MQTNVDENFGVNERIMQLIEYLKVSNNQFANLIGISSSRISNIATKRNKPDSDLLARIAKTYPDVSGNWLLTGEGYMILQKFPKIAGISAGKIAGNSEKNAGITADSQEMTEDQGLQLTINKQMVKLLIDETKELSAENAVLKHENTQLKAENAQLQGKIEELEGKSEDVNKQRRSAS